MQFKPTCIHTKKIIPVPVRWLPGRRRRGLWLTSPRPTGPAPCGRRRARRRVAQALSPAQLTFHTRQGEAALGQEPRPERGTRRAAARGPQHPPQSFWLFLAGPGVETPAWRLPPGAHSTCQGTPGARPGARGRSIHSRCAPHGGLRPRGPSAAPHPAAGPGHGGRGHRVLPSPGTKVLRKRQMTATGKGM